MITVERKTDGSYAVLDRHMHLRMQLQMHGHAEVVDQATGVALRVHIVNDRIHAVATMTELTGQ